MGFRFVLAPMLLDTVTLVGVALVFNRLTRRCYPFRQVPAQPRPHAGLSAEDLSALLHRLNQSANIGTEDFGRLLDAAQAECHRRQPEPRPARAIRLPRRIPALVARPLPAAGEADGTRKA